MKNLKLLQLLETVLGKGKPTSGDNIAFFSPFTSHYKPIQTPMVIIHGIVGFLIIRVEQFILYLNH